MGNGGMVEGIQSYESGMPMMTKTLPLPLILRDSLLEIIGNDGVRLIWQSASWTSTDSLSATNLGRMEVALCNVFGQAAGEGLSLRVGRAALTQVICQMGPEMGLLDLDFRLQRARLRIRKGLECLAEVLWTPIGVQCELEEQVECWCWTLYPSQSYVSFNGRIPPTSFIKGLVQEYFAWSSGGKIYPVESHVLEKEDISAYAFRINKQPLE